MGKQYKAVEWLGVSLKQAAGLSDLFSNSKIPTDVSSYCYDPETQLFSYSLCSNDLTDVETLITDMCVKAGLPKPSTKVDSLPGIRLMAAQDIAAKVPAITDKSRETKTDINKGIVATTIDAVKNFFSDLFS